MNINWKAAADKLVLDAKGKPGEDWLAYRTYMHLVIRGEDPGYLTKHEDPEFRKGATRARKDLIDLATALESLPAAYPVSLRLNEASVREVALPKVLSDLVLLGSVKMVESVEHLQISVLARNLETAKRRAAVVAESVRGVIVEVGEPTPLQHYAKQKALPYRRSFVYGRYKPGRFSVQGGEGLHNPAPSTANVSANNPVGLPLGEAVDPYKAARHHIKMQYLALGFSPEESEEQASLELEELLDKLRQKHPNLNTTQLASLASRKAKADRERIMQGKKQNESAASKLKGFPYAQSVNAELSRMPVEWFSTSQGRHLTVEAISRVLEREGDKPASVLEDTYLGYVRRHHTTGVDSPAPQSPAVKEHKVVAKFYDERARDFAVANIARFCESCTCAEKQPGLSAMFLLQSEDQDAKSEVEEALYRMNLKQRSIVL